MYIGVIFCITETCSDGRELEKLADCEVLATANAVKSSLESQGSQVELLNIKSTRVTDLREFDWVFNLTETIDGFVLKDYEIAEQMELLGIPFTGSGSTTLKLCSDKAAVKSMLSHYGVCTPAFEVVKPGAEIRNRLEFPLIVKPLHEDGSIGIFKDSVVCTTHALIRMVHRIHHRYHQAALVEEFIEGRDIAVSILGNLEDLAVLPPSECVFLEGFRGPKILTFDAKWVEESPDFKHTASVCPCELEPETRENIISIAGDVYNLMGCRDYARVDFRLQGRTPYVLEVNPNPCINPIDSGFLRAAQLVGLNYDDLILEILNQSMINRSRVRFPDYVR
jgi:D-alanine-D-alanine ligase